MLDDRVSKLNLTTSGDDNAFTLTAAQAENLGSYEVEINGTAVSSILIKDRSSAIQEFIESGSIPSKVKLSFAESSSQKIELNFSESEALKDLIISGKAIVQGITLNSGQSSVNNNELESNVVNFEPDRSSSTKR